MPHAADCSALRGSRKTPPTSAPSASATVTTSLPSTGEWRFRVFLGEREIGQHRFVVVGRGSTRDARSEARFAVTALGFNAFS